MAGGVNTDMKAIGGKGLAQVSHNKDLMIEIESSDSISIKSDSD